MDAIELFPIQEETLSFDEFVKLFETRRSDIERTVIQPPCIGEAGFGGIRVRYKYPIYKSLYGNQSTTKAQ